MTRLLPPALQRRAAMLQRRETTSFRVFSGQSDGIDGVYIDVYGPGAVLIVYEGRAPARFDPHSEANATLEVLRAAATQLGIEPVQAVYVKPFARDRSRLGGALPELATDPIPAASVTTGSDGKPTPLADALAMRELAWTFEVRLYDGLSTGVFLDQRENRRFVHQWCLERRGRGAPEAAKQISVLNTFAYTCVFSVAAALAGAVTTSVDVSGKYLDWGRRNFTLSGLDPEAHRFAKMDTFEFFAYAARKTLRYDLIILDPPSFGSGSKRRGIRPWSAVDGYARLVAGAMSLLRPGGLILASTNTQELCIPGRLEREIVRGLSGPAVVAERPHHPVKGRSGSSLSAHRGGTRAPRWVDLPAAPDDFATERNRFAAHAFVVGA